MLYWYTIYHPHVCSNSDCNPSFSKALKDLPSHQSRYKGIHSSDLGTAPSTAQRLRAEALRQLTPIAAQCSCAIASSGICGILYSFWPNTKGTLWRKLCICFCVLCDISSSIVSTEGKSSVFQPSMQQGFLQAKEYFSSLKSAIPSADCRPPKCGSSTLGWLERPDVLHSKKLIDSSWQMMYSAKQN